MKRPINHILVDANIARSATEPARHPTSRLCLVLAEALIESDSQTGAAMTPALSVEWRNHASPKMVGWLASMESKGRIRRVRDKHVRDLRKAVSALADVGVRAALEKDIHLSEAAIMNGFAVASQDEKQRKFLARLSVTYDLAGKIQWLNPVAEPGDWPDWIRGGCADTESYRCRRAT